MTEQFFEYAIEDITNFDQNAKDFMDFIDRAHGSICSGTIVCLTHNLFLRLKNFFVNEEGNSWEEKKQFFNELCKKKKKKENIFMNIYHLKKYGFVVICS